MQQLFWGCCCNSQAQCTTTVETTVHLSVGCHKQDCRAAYQPVCGKQPQAELISAGLIPGTSFFSLLVLHLCKLSCPSQAALWKRTANEVGYKLLGTSIVPPKGRGYHTSKVRGSLKIVLHVLGHTLSSLWVLDLQPALAEDSRSAYRVGAWALESKWQEAQQSGSPLTVAPHSSGSPLTIKLPWGTRGSSRGKSVVPTPSPPFREGLSSAPHADTQSITEGRYLSMLKIHINGSVKGFHLK